MKKFGDRIMRSLAAIVCGVALLGPITLAEPLLNASAIPVQSRTYSIKDNYCRLLAHGSFLLKDPETNSLRIVIDGGMAKYTFNWEGRAYEVPDLNKHTAILELGQDFSLDKLPLRVKHKPPNVPVLNRGLIWTDETFASIYIGTGHFFEQAYWDESQFYVPIDEIPPFSLWKYDLNAGSWEEIHPNGPEMTRLISAAYTSIPSINKSFAFGGYFSNRSAPQVAEFDVSMMTNGMMIYDHSNNEIVNVTDPSDPNGYTHGALHHIIPEDGSEGMLLNLMAIKCPLQTHFVENLLKPPMEAYDFTQIRFYDLKTNEWITQAASFFNDEKPETRTRFCSVLVKDEETKSWDLWVYGGQKADDPEKGANDIWVLTMPAFMWIKITNTLDNIEVRGHTCHAIGNQFVVLGGYPPSFRVRPEEKCDSRLMRVFDMTQMAWTSSFTKDTKYVQPKQVRKIANATREPLSVEWEDGRLAALYEVGPITTTSTTTTTGPTLPPPTTSGSGGGGGGGLSKLTITLIAVLGTIIVIAVAIGAYLLYRRKHTHRGQHSIPAASSVGAPIGPHSRRPSDTNSITHNPPYEHTHRHRPPTMEPSYPNSVFHGVVGPSPGPYESPSQIMRVRSPDHEYQFDIPAQQEASANPTLLNRSSHDLADDEKAASSGDNGSRRNTRRRNEMKAPGTTTVTLEPR